MKGYFRKRGTKWSFSIDVGRDPETGKRKQKTVSGFKTKKEAEKACAEMITKIEKGEYVEESKETLGEFLIEFMENKVKHSIRASTYHNQIFMTKKQLLPALGSKKLKDIKPLDIQKFYSKKMEEGLSAAYIKQLHSILTKAFRTALEWGLIEKNVMATVKAPRIQKKNMAIWTMKEANQFLEYVKERKFFIVYVLAIYTGMRKGEILGLRWRDCDLENNTISIQQTLYKTNGTFVFQEPKTKGSKRIITISDFVVHCLKKQKARQNEWKLRLGQAYQSSDLVAANWVGTPIDPTHLHCDFKSSIQKAGVPVIRFHDLRHTHATLLLQMGENPKVVSERLGHADVSITLDTYAHVLPNMQKDLAKKFDAAMRDEMG
jgi:integrase